MQEVRHSGGSCADPSPSVMAGWEMRTTVTCEPMRNPWTRKTAHPAVKDVCFSQITVFEERCSLGEGRVGASGKTWKRKMWFGTNICALEESASHSPLRLGSAYPAHSLHFSASRLSACGWKWLISASHQLLSFRKMQQLPKVHFKN